MENALKAWPKIRRRARGKPLFLFLDFDGTLAPIAPTPEQAALPKEMKKTLMRLAGLPGCRLAIVSGRSLVDIKKKAGLRGIIYAGNHGLEVSGSGIGRAVHAAPRFGALIRRISKDLSGRLSGIRGAVLQEKGLSLSLHYRLVKKNQTGALVRRFHDVVDPLLKRGEVVLKKGKKVFEVMPPSGWDKGRVVLWLLRRFKKGSLPFYIGDDTTDEDAFGALKGRGVSIVVGQKKKTRASYQLKNTAQVLEFLLKIEFAMRIR